MSTEQGKAEGSKAPAASTAKGAKVTIKNVPKGKTATAGAKTPGKPPAKPTVKVTMSAAPAPKGKKPTEIPDGLPKKYFFKSTFNTHDIMHSPVEKTINMIDKILSGERLFTM